MKIILIEIMKMRYSIEPSNRCIENMLNAMEINMLKD